MRNTKFDIHSIGDLFLTLLVMFGTAALAWAGLTGTRNYTNESKPASAKPFTEPANIPEDAFVIVIDAGHGGFDGGAIGDVTGTAEAGLNLEVAKLLSNDLTARGFWVIMTRKDDNALGDSKQADMAERRRIMKLGCVDAVISIHMNKFGDKSVKGPMVFYMKNSDEGKRLADKVIERICENVSVPKRFSNPEDLFVLREPSAPSVLVECGFLSNADDEARLMTPEYREKLVKGIAEGLTDYFLDMKNGL